MKRFDVVRVNDTKKVGIIVEVDRHKADPYKVRISSTEFDNCRRSQLTIIEDEELLNDDGMNYAGIGLDPQTGDKIGLTGFCPNDDETQVTAGFDHFASNSKVEYTVKIQDDENLKAADFIELKINNQLHSLDDLDSVLRDWVIDNAQTHIGLVVGLK